MQPSTGYGLPHIHHHHQQQQPNNVSNGGEYSSSSSTLSISNPQQTQIYHPNPVSFQEPRNPPPLMFQSNHHQLPTVTHQLFQQQQHFQQFHPHPEQQGLHQFFSVNFKLGLNEKSGFGESSGFDEHTFKNRTTQLLNQQPVCERLATRISDCSSRECDNAIELERNQKIQKHDETNNGIFCELEAIYSRTPKIEEEAEQRPVTKRVDHESNPFTGKEEEMRKKKNKRKRKRKLMKDQMNSMGVFFDNLMKQVVDHQENLQRNVVKVIERIDRDRRKKEEEWRREESEKHTRETIASVREQSLASKRESLIVSYIEKLTGQTLNLPSRDFNNTKEVSDFK